MPIQTEQKVRVWAAGAINIDRWRNSERCGFYGNESSRDLLPPPEPAAVFEASGVIVVKSDCFVVLDNIRRVARIDASLRLDSERNQWVGARRSGEGYEAVSYNPKLRRFFLMIEAEKHADGTYKAIVEEADARWRFKGRTWVDFAFEARNTGFEGLAAVESGGRNYLLALCEGNKCRRSRKKLEHGKGRIHVLQRRQGMWHPVAVIKLPGHVSFQDYAGLALRGDRIASSRRSHHACGLAASTGGSGRLPVKAAFTTFRGRKRESACITRSRASRG